MNAPEVQQGLLSLGFSSTQHNLMTGVSDHPNINSVWVYPNPSSERVVIKSGSNSGNQSFKVFDTQGRVVSLGLLDGNRTVIDMRDLPSGVYHIVIVDFEERKLTERILKN